MKFNRLIFPKGEIVLDHVLQCGQAFRWIWNHEKRYYSASMLLNDKLGYRIIVLKQPDQCSIEFSVAGNKDDDCSGAARQWLMRYLRMEVNLEALLAEWQKADTRFIGKTHRGVRILRQEPWETLCSFICSSNNNIGRITKMCHALCSQYGSFLGELDGTPYYSFPTSKQLMEGASEDALRDLGFGYRAKYIMAAAEWMDSSKPAHMSDTEHLESWLDMISREEIRQRFMEVPGVGPKVADCVCLMGMQMDDHVPVDVHINRIAQRDYKFNASAAKIAALKARYKDLPSVRKKLNMELELVREMFIQKWGPYAGWAQGVLFAQEINKSDTATKQGPASNQEVAVAKRKVEEKDFLHEAGSEAAVVEVALDGVEFSASGRPLRTASKRIRYST
ncbi:AER127Cp [Eremothecium gossypii ATCC 10895]|uniref:N-glycosylase/DNA lyase n=1 Tax=Eremothecium gossypii (strain ATCC 10895 / CBS 109.51 / FGSC 9923 / NRRL Y-1056) TaxID=284811 RepID=Q756Y7_EREGS|nr:AER127Cp [Eremothecium gossypii ATCC 10895]AAS52810.1 AER127Cp [Eremothecium gossypii ATCC 10895]